MGPSSTCYGCLAKNFPVLKEEVAVQGEATTSLIVVLGGFSLVILAIVGIVSLWLRFREETILEAEIEPHPPMDS